MLRLLYIKKRIIVSVTVASLLSSSWVFTTANAFPWNKQDLWQALTGSFSLVQNAPATRLNRQIKAYLSDKAYVEQLSRNAQPYLYYVYQEVKKRHMPAEIAFLPMVESDYYPYCLSGPGASGLWQLMAPTAKDMKIPMNWWMDGRRGVIASTKESLDFLSYLHTYYKGSWPLALAAYNSGQGTVNAAIKRNKRRHLSTNYWDLKLPKETEDYVPKLLAIADIMQHANKYHIKLAPVANAPAFSELQLNHPINLQLMADALHIDSNTLLRLNPEFNHWVTPPRRSVTLLVPSNKAELAQIAVQYITPQTLWQHYVVKANDSFRSIAAQNGISVQTLQHINYLKNLHVHVGQVLLLPMDYSHADSKHATRVVHSVVAKETLNSIAKHYHVTTSNLRAWNNVPKRGVFTGETLVIWSPSLAVFDTHPRHSKNLFVENAQAEKQAQTKAQAIAHTVVVAMHANTVTPAVVASSNVNPVNVNTANISSRRSLAMLVHDFFKKII